MQQLLPIIDDSDLHKPGAEAPSDNWSWQDASEWKLFRSSRASESAADQLFIADGSRVFQIDSSTVYSLQSPPASAAQQMTLLETLGISRLGAVSDDAPEEMAVRALSLAVAQKCNLGCTYCYAEGGSFGEAARNMSADVALQAVDRLFCDTTAGDRVSLSFLGGEPLVNRSVIQLATQAAVEKAKAKDVAVSFSITTNGTLLTPEDGEFFERHGFAVTVSLDGIGSTHDALRSYKSGRGSYAEILRHIKPLLEMQARMQVSARVTVTPDNLSLGETLEEFLRLGFHSVGFSPMLASPNGRREMNPAQLQEMLSQMKSCGRRFADAVRTGRRYPFSNMVTAMQEIHRGTHRPYPCGAGAGYFGVSADGELFACHRFVGNTAGSMGDLDSGVDPQKQHDWLQQRHVHFQKPCSTCWARYLCGGGCHHEVINRGRPACDYIRGWLEFCLSVYVELVEECPQYFCDPDSQPAAK